MPKLELRLYQKNVVDAIGSENAIVKMPTGSGKTFVAAEFIKRGLQQRQWVSDGGATVICDCGRNSSSSSLTASLTASVASQTSFDSTSQVSYPRQNSQRGSNNLAALFLVPTCDLVSQQKRALAAWIGDHYEVVDYMGGKVTPKKRFDVLVSTPQAFLVRIL